MAKDCSVARAVSCLGLILPLVLLPVSGCKSGASSSELRIFAASSLTEVFRELERRFEATNPGAEVLLSFAGSQVLRTQIKYGAPVDLFASADPSHLEALTDSGRVDSSQVFAHNELALITPPSNPAGIESLRDLPRARHLVIGTPNVPVGRYTRRMLKRAAERWGQRFEAAALFRVVSEESNVRLVRAKVELGEADAALVYRSDLTAGVRSVPVAADLNVRAEYRIGVIKGSESRALAERWLTLILSAEGQALLQRHGFGVQR